MTFQGPDEEAFADVRRQVVRSWAVLSTRLIRKIPSGAVFGVPDAKTGEAVKVFVVTNDKDLGAGDLRRFCREHLTAYKVPKHVEFRDELPRLNVGKILRRELRDQ